MSEGRPIDLVRRMHRLVADGRRRILHEGDVVAEFHTETAGRLDAGIRQHADDDDLFDPQLFQLVVEVCVRETALRPVLFDNDVALLGLEIIVRINDGSQVRQKVHGLCHLFGQWPKLALRGEEVVIGVDEKKSSPRAIVLRISPATSPL